MYLRQLRGLAVRLSGLFNKEKQDREMSEELDCLLAMHIEDHLRAGIAPTEARRRALIEIGGETTREEYRRQRGLPLIETTIQDLRYAMRMLAKRPGFALIAILSLGLGIGANTAIFSIVNTAVLRPLPVEKPEQIVALQNAGELRINAGFSYPNYKDYRDRNKIFDGLIGYRFAPLSVSYDGIYEKMWGYIVTGNYFEVLGLKPAVGRLIASEDDQSVGGHPVAVVGYKFWQQKFGANPGVIGKIIIVNGRAFTVIGVAPKGFLGTELVASPDMWFPMAMQGEIEMGSNWLTKRDTELTMVQGRLKPGISYARAEAELNSIAEQLEKEYPDDNEGKRILVSRPGAGMRNGAIRGAVLGFAGLLMAAVGFVLLLACTNLANLLLARASERRNEIAVRLALGASRGRLIKQLLAESMLLSIGSGLFGLFLAYCLIRLATSIKLPTEFPLAVDLHLDYRVLAFTIVVSLATGLLFGLLPALQATKVDLQPSLKDETSFAGYRRSWGKSCLIVLQVALSLVLLVAGGLTFRALQRAQTLNFGFNPQNALAVSFDLRLQGYDATRGREFQKRLLERVRAVQSVQYAGIIDLAPVDLHFGRASINAQGQAPERNAPYVMLSRITPGYFQAVGSGLARGRDFTEADDENAPRVAIVNETFARQFWPGQDPIGKTLTMSNQNSPTLQVVGVVQDGKYASLTEDSQPYLCRPMAQTYTGSSTMIVRTAGDPNKMLAAIRSEVRQMDPQMPVSAAPLGEKLALPLLPARITAWLFGFFGLLALLLAAIGIYGVMSFIVSRRTHEIGVRMALGAESSHVLRLTITQGLILSLIGTAIGLTAALALTQSMKSILFGVSASDPLTYIAVAALLIGVSVLACYLPARRATKISPMIALRAE